MPQFCLLASVSWSLRQYNHFSISH